jgi:uncharacterized membrane protein YhdT
MDCQMQMSIQQILLERSWIVFRYALILTPGMAPLPLCTVKVQCAYHLALVEVIILYLVKPL